MPVGIRPLCCLCRHGLEFWFVGYGKLNHIESQIRSRDRFARHGGASPASSPQPHAGWLMGVTGIDQQHQGRDRHMKWLRDTRPRFKASSDWSSAAAVAPHWPLPFRALGTGVAGVVLAFGLSFLTMGVTPSAVSPADAAHGRA